jgi:HAD superfamily phosphoserine phosphatase-like hydrolase
MTFSTPEQFLAAVLALRPRLAVFDCDGTLWSSDSGEAFMDWEIERRLLAPEVAAWISERYRRYREGKVAEEIICGEMVTVHEGLPHAELERAAREFFEEKIVPRIFPEMLTLARRLGEAGCELWAVSSTNDWVVRAGVERFGIPPGRVLAASVHLENGLATGRLLRVPSGPDKAVAVREVIARVPDIAFGNSIHDLELLECAQHPFAINPNPDLEGIARRRGWPLYSPAVYR